MASYPHAYGYEDGRFENAVSQNFHCPICRNVFKEPVMCRRNQHCFCRLCITTHLNNSQTCPSCMEELTLDSLRQAPRVLLDCLSELNIRCDYFSRGCREFVQLENLESHVKDCGFAPVVCSNEGCLMEINKRDRARHEAEVCELRKVKCRNCAEITKTIEDMKLILTAVKEKVDEIDELKEQVDQLGELRYEIGLMNIRQDEIMKEVQEIRRSARKKQPSILVAGGRRKGFELLQSAEIFHWSTRSWSQLQPMKECRSAASSFPYRNKAKITVAGGTAGDGKTNTMEQINIYPLLNHSAQWSHFPAQLPGALAGHKTVVYKEKLIVIGGLDDDVGASDSIYEVLLRPPYTIKLLGKMPQSRLLHGVELFNDKILILGGSSSLNCRANVDEVLVYDIINNKCLQITPLPVSVFDMATVKWGDNVILFGGKDKDGNTLDTVTIYNVNTEKSKTLPEMKHKRRGCAAVVSENTIVVMGGKDQDGNYLKSVEAFTFDRFSWEDLPPMNQERCRHIAVTV